MTTSIGSATALAAILKEVTADSAAPVDRRWEAALGAKPGSEDFAYRHAEVCVLVSDVAKDLSSLPDGDPVKALYTPYLSRWHNAVCFREQWRTTTTGHLIDSGDLDVLSTLGMLRDQKLGGHGLTESQVNQLHESLSAWHDLLAANALPVELTDEVRSSVAHLEWLLDQIETFGSEPVKRQGRNLLGLAFSSGTTTLVNKEWRETFRRAVAGMMAALAVATVWTGEVREITENTAGIIEAAQTIAEDLDKPTDPRALPPGNSGDVSEDSSSDE